VKFGGLTLLLTTATTGVQAAEKTLAEPELQFGAELPNIVFILADDIGYGDLGAYGGSIPTPNIDSLAQNGMRFTDAHSSAALCAPSRFSLLTGSYPYRNGRPGGSWDINYSSGFTEGSAHLREGRHLTLGDVLQRAGYVTGFVGKMHVGGDVFDTSGILIREKDRLNEMDFSRGIRNGLSSHGFDYVFGLPSGIQHEPYAFFENGRYRPIDPRDPANNSSTVLLYDGEYRIGNNGISEIVEAGKIPARTDRRYDSSQVGPMLTDQALAFIDRSLEERQRTGRHRPFALYYASQAIHVPHTPPIDFDADPTVVDLPVKGVTGGSTSDMIVELDLQVGALLSRLESAGLLEDTLVFFTSDNGALPPTVTDYGTYAHDSNGPMRDYKASVYEGGHRVPFIAQWGDVERNSFRIPPGTVADQTIMAHDWVATIYALTGQVMAPDQAMDSASLLPVLLCGSDEPVHDFVLYQAGFAMLGAIRRGQYVLVIDEHRQATELYDLARDPAQTENLIGEATHAPLVDELRRIYLRHRDRDTTTFDEPRTTPVLGRNDAPNGSRDIKAGP